MNFLAAFCSSIPADWMRKTKGAAEPSRMGTSGASRSTQALSMPNPAKADIRCSMVPTLTPSRSRQEHIRVSPTIRAWAGKSTGSGRSTRRKDDTGIRRGRTQRHIHLDAAMKANARGANQGLERALPEHVSV